MYVLGVVHERAHGVFVSTEMEVIFDDMEVGPDGWSSPK